MIIETLTMHDFGLYRGCNTLELAPPSPDKPVVLFGGLNGAGKTTLLDAVQLCLFGQFARISNRNGMAYDDYLARSIHRGAGASEASIELAFRSIIDGEDQKFRVKRSWRRTAKGVREQLEVLRNGNVDRIATDHWSEQVEEFIPARIAHLFLFDGEKIEGYAEPRSSAALIETAVYNLLGLDLVERLTSDLTVLERRRKLEYRDQSQRELVESLEKKLKALEIERDRAHQQCGALQLKLDQARRKLNEFEERYKKEGGRLYERRVELERLYHVAEHELQACEKEMREHAASAAPLALIHALVEQVATQDAREVSARRASETSHLLASRDAALLTYLSESAAPGELLRALTKFLEQDRSDRAVEPTASILALSEEGRVAVHGLLSGELTQVQKRTEQILLHELEARRRLDELTAQVAAVPSDDVLADLIIERQAAAEDVRRLELSMAAAEAELERARREVGIREQELERLHSREVELSLEQQDLERTLRHSERVRVTLEHFRKAVITRHLKRIEALVLDSFKQLIRKKSLVADLKIDPETFQIQLGDRENGILTPERLSAGERQLLAVAVLWGLARASGRPLPMIIDTPLGRLDSSHRRHLVSHYFPNASHQVILLSTDEEIAGSYLTTLAPFIGRTYKIVYDEAEGRTSVTPGYFLEGGHGH